MFFFLKVPTKLSNHVKFCSDWMTYRDLQQWGAICPPPSPRMWEVQKDPGQDRVKKELILHCTKTVMDVFYRDHQRQFEHE